MKRGGADGCAVAVVVGSVRPPVAVTFRPDSGGGGFGRLSGSMVPTTSSRWPTYRASCDAWLPASAYVIPAGSPAPVDRVLESGVAAIVPEPLPDGREPGTALASTGRVAADALVSRRFSPSCFASLLPDVATAALVCSVTHPVSVMGGCGGAGLVS